MSSPEIPPQQLHEPVLLQSTVDALAPEKGDSYLDLTAGYGGHAREVIQRIGTAQRATLVDQDDFAIQHLQDLKKQGARLIESDYATAVSDLVDRGGQFDMILIDLGVSSPQLDDSERGFSIVRPGPLDMRMDRRRQETAADLVNTVAEQQLVDILRTYGQEPRARTIAKGIIDARPIRTTTELADIVKKAYRGTWTKVHPATRTFQALRIALNDELGQLERTLPMLPRLLRPRGRVAIISFHSLEDRLVKRFFKEQAESGYEAELAPLTKQPIDGATYDVHNPRARSAKLRAAVKK